MERSHKDINRWPLVSALATNLILYYWLISGLDLSTLTGSQALSHVCTILPGGLAVALSGVVNAQLTPMAKARIVFLKWDNPLPGCEAFSKHAHDDIRIDMALVESKFGPLPTDPRAQNTLWYCLYQQVQDSAAVRQIDRNWLFARDYACVVALLAPLLGIAGILQMPSGRAYAAMLAMLIVQYLLASQAARNNARRLVTTVIAQSSARYAAQASAQ